MGLEHQTGLEEGLGVHTLLGQSEETDGQKDSNILVLVYSYTLACLTAQSYTHMPNGTEGSAIMEKKAHTQNRQFIYCICGLYTTPL